MRILLVMFALFVLAGCAAGPSLGELKAQALTTGDWSLVEKREAQIARRTRRGPDCPAGTVAYCRNFMGDTNCACVSSDSMYTVLSGRR